MKRILCALALSSLALTGAARAEDTAPNGAHDETPAHAEAAHREREVQRLTFTNELVGAKDSKGGTKTWLPATATVKAGKKLEIKLVNTLDAPHGFRAIGLLTDEHLVIGPHETKTITIDDPKHGSYKFDCELHPAHVGGTITVE